MPESGGSTAQSGIYYQNSIAALFLGRLCDMDARPAYDRVIQVRVEAPEHVDDILVTYADGHLDYTQAKESISTSGEAWEKLWRNFDAQRWDPRFGSEDRLILVAGDCQRHKDLREICNRADGASDYREWRVGLTKDMSSLVDRIQPLLSLEHQDDASVWALFSRIDVWPTMTLEQIERDEVPRWIPPSNVAPQTLFRLLRDRAGGHARYRQVFQATWLLHELLDEHNISVVEPPSSGVPAYREALSQIYGRIGVPGINMVGSVDELYLWPALHEVETDLTVSVPEEDTFYEPDRRGTIDLRHFPHMTLQQAVVVAGSGFGKTTLLVAMAYRLAQSNWLPALIRLPDLAARGQTVIEFLDQWVNRDFNVAVQWDHYCDSGRAVMLFDGLDELKPSDRPEILRLIHTFTSRYQQVPWLLTVRDSAAFSIPIETKVIGIETLRYEEIDAFADAYHQAGSMVDVDYLLSQLRRYPDLRRLARIPLFLALLLATTEPSEALPRKRSDLLERYLYVMLHPDEHKASVHQECDPYELRNVAERLAFVALERQKTGFTEREVDLALKDMNRSQRVPAYITDLITCGMLNRSAHQISFVFPIVQEYLAACFLVHHLPDEVASRFELAARQPWAQTLQFALEQHPQADRIVNLLLETPDDAFGTMLRLVARCIINGAPVSSETCLEVGDRLADLWTSSSRTVQENVGELLADGFTNPLPTRARALLEQGWGLQIGGAEIVTACDDPSLTRATLQAFLQKDLEHQYYLHGWQSAVDAIADEAIAYYLQRVKSERTTPNEVKALASLIQHVSPQRLPPQTYGTVTDDPTLPSIIQLAGFFLGDRPLPAPASTLVDEIIRSPKATNDRWPSGWNLAVDALWCGHNPVEHWQAYVHDPSISDGQRLDLLFSLLSSPLETPTQMNLLKQLERDDSLPIDLRRAILLLLAYLGDASAMQDVTNLLAELSFENLSMWALIASKHRSRDIVFVGLRQIGVMPLEPYQRVQLARDLALGLTSDAELHGYAGGWSSKGAILHPAASECASIVWQWAQEYDGSIAGCLILLGAACELGYPGALESLAEELIYLAEHECDLLQDFGFDNTVSNCLQTVNMRHQLLPLHVLQRYVEASEANAALTAMSMIAKHASHEALDLLLQLHSRKTTYFLQEGIAQHVEKLAGRLGIRIVWDKGQLARDPQAGAQ